MRTTPIRNRVPVLFKASSPGMIVSTSMWPLKDKVKTNPRNTKKNVLTTKDSSEWNCFILSSRTNFVLILNILAISSLLPRTRPKISAAIAPLPPTSSTNPYRMNRAAIVIMKEKGFP